MKMGKKKDFEIFQTMIDQDLDIGVHMESLNFQRDKRGGKVTFGVANPHFDHLINQAGTGKLTHYAMVLVVNIEQFKKLQVDCHYSTDEEYKNGS